MAFLRPCFYGKIDCFCLKQGKVGNFKTMYYVQILKNLEKKCLHENMLTAISKMGVHHIKRKKTPKIQEQFTRESDIVPNGFFIFTSKYKNS